MNSFINVLLLVITFPTMLLSVFVGFDLPIDLLKTTGAQIPYRFEVFLGFGLLYAIISLRRSIRRWMGVRMTSQKMKFAWNGEVSKERKQRVFLYTVIESVVLFFLAFSYYLVTKEAIFICGVLLFFSVESLLFLLINAKSNFRVGITSKAILVSDREIILIYLAGLRKVSVSQQTVYFDYIQDLQLSFPIDCVEPAERAAFFTTLEAQLDPDRVLFQNTQSRK
ncbi:MAG: hypothetical protein NWR96_05645 [Crocinitomicaceae bacterium]|jgi:hypothetical protein|nr:hypothetical protein [Crocinitomicaceae bacterium]